MISRRKRMTSRQRVQYRAAYLLAVAASGDWSTLRDLSEQVTGSRPADLRVARLALVASIGHGLNWREVRAEAEAKLRSGWWPR